MAISIGLLSIVRIEQTVMSNVLLTDLLPDVDAAALERHSAALLPHFIDPTQRFCTISIHSWLIRARGLTVLIDTCAGNGKVRPSNVKWNNRADPYIERLAAFGCRPEDVDYVFCTHFHIDHVGYNTSLVGNRWLPTFPNARYVFSRAEHDFWDPANPFAEHLGESDRIFEDSIAPIIESKQAILVDDGWDLDGVFRIVQTGGHTPGHIVVEATSDGECAVFAGDLLHHPIQIYEPHLNSGHCRDGAVAHASRCRILESCADKGALLLPAHFASPHAGYVARESAGFAFEPALRNSRRRPKLKFEEA
jgi:glyoxylase-like metal-dependent hydrolase (beta-lactamase superfamily II)